MAVEKALEKIGAIQLPIGGLCSMDNILMYLKKFKPQVIMGIPSLLILNAEYGENNGAEISIPKVFYAGEALSEMRQEYLRKVWKTETFCSAGYASVDAGVIGYQCSHCKTGEHHLFSDLVEMKIIDDEAIITSICRNTLPIVNYRSGDRVQWLPDCACGRKDKRFKLMGRIDNVIQIWSCRLLVNDIEKSLQEIDHNVHTYQIVIKESREANVVREKLELHYEIHGDPLDAEVLTETIYRKSRDLKDTISYEDFKKEVILVPTSPGKIGRNGRTGKISIVLDQRH
jgi:phenylacetate-CoA ligase